MEDTRKRPQAKAEDIDRVFAYAKEMLLERLDEKGRGIYVSSHEVLGILDEEFNELRDAVRSNDYHELWRELLDIAVGALFGMVSIRDGRMDWPKVP